jgi:hypothetical protein
VDSRLAQSCRSYLLRFRKGGSGVERDRPSPAPPHHLRTLTTPPPLIYTRPCGGSQTRGPARASARRSNPRSPETHQPYPAADRSDLAAAGDGRTPGTGSLTTDSERPRMGFISRPPAYPCGASRCARIPFATSQAGQVAPGYSTRRSGAVGRDNPPDPQRASRPCRRRNLPEPERSSRTGFQPVSNASGCGPIFTCSIVPRRH